MKNNGKVRGIGKTSMEVGKMWNKFGLRLVSVGLALALLLGATIPVCEARAAGEKVVNIGLATCYTGPLASLGTPFCNGVFDYVRYLNGQGGINGVKFEVVWRESRWSVPENCIAFRKLAEEGIALFFCTPAMAPLIPIAQREGIPLVVADIVNAESLSTPQWILYAYNDSPSILIQTIMWVQRNRWTEARPMKVGVMVYDFTAGYYTLDGIKYKNGALLDRIGVEFVGHEVVPMAGCIDSSTEWLRLASKKPDWVFTTVLGSSMTTVVKDAARLEIQQKGIKLFATTQSLDECILAVVGKKDANGWYANGVGFPAAVGSFERFPGRKIYAEAEKKYRGIKPEELKGWGMAGWAVTVVGVEAIRLAIEEVGFENLTGRIVRDILFGDRIKDFDTGCVVPMPTITDSNPWFIRRFQVCEIKQGEYHLVGEGLETPSFYISPEEFETALEK